MPHQCTGCGHAFEDGSKEMLSGCPECGGNTFQFRPEGAPLPDDPEPPDDAPEGTGPPDPEERAPVAESGSVAETVGRATTKVRDFVSTNPYPAGTERQTPPDPDRSWPSERDAGSNDPSGGTASGDPSNDRRSLDGSPSDDWGPEDLPNTETQPGSDGESSTGSDGEASTGSDGEIIDADARRDERGGPGDDEDDAQASARTDVVTNDELNDVSPPRGTGPSCDQRAPDGRAESPQSETAAKPGGSDAGATPDHPDVDGDGEVVGRPSGDDPDLAELREQLNDQFESIKIIEPGQYELNLMELYDREEYIIALQENGRYVIQVPDQWIGDDLDDR